MDTIILAVVVVAILVAAYLFVWNKQRAPKASPKASEPSGDAGLGPDLNLDSLQPGDILGLWNGKEPVVERVVACHETLPTRITHWKWVFLEGGQTLALSPVGNVLYTDTSILYQGSAPYEQLTGEVESGGVLKTFEARVREGSVGANPVVFEHEGERYRLQSTGTFGAADQPLPDAEVWRDVQVDESQNVYFKLTDASGAQLLGIWTSHIALLKGQPLGAADVREIYRVQR